MYREASVRGRIDQTLSLEEVEGLDEGCAADSQLLGEDGLIDFAAGDQCSPKDHLKYGPVHGAGGVLRGPVRRNHILLPTVTVDSPSSVITDALSSEIEFKKDDIRISHEIIRVRNSVS